MDGATHPNCPKCHSNASILTSIRFTQRVFFCPSCKHAWKVGPDEDRPGAAPESDQTDSANDIASLFLFR